jgi:hypothetical protein
MEKKLSFFVELIQDVELLTLSIRNPTTETNFRKSLPDSHACFSMSFPKETQTNVKTPNKRDSMEKNGQEIHTKIDINRTKNISKNKIGLEWAYLWAKFSVLPTLWGAGKN